MKSLFSRNRERNAAPRCGALAGSAALYVVLLGVSGCSSLQKNDTYRDIMSQTVLGSPDTGPQNGPDMAYLADEAPARSSGDNKSGDENGAANAAKTLTAQMQILPLQAGNFWDMITQNKKTQKVGEETLVVVGSAANAYGQTGVGVETRRNGKRFRYELYKNDASGLYLLAAQDETSPLMSYNPPFPLVKYPAKEGDTYIWHGETRLGKETFPSNGMGRLTLLENSKTQLAGTFPTYRLDGIISLIRAGQDVRFPSVRWLAPHIGFVRRGYAEKGDSTYAEVKKFNTR